LADSGWSHRADTRFLPSANATAQGYDPATEIRELGEEINAASSGTSFLLEKQYEQRDDVDFGSQIRSYVLHPYQQVKDLRTEWTEGDVESVLDGELDPFVEAYLLQEDMESEDDAG